MGAIAVVRLRGHRRVRGTVEESMAHLNLTRANHCVVVPDTPQFVGMVQSAKDYVTWGPVNASEVEALIRNRGRLAGDKPFTDADAKARTKFATIKELAAAVADGKVRWGSIEGVKPIFRLQPPRQGLKGGAKRSVRAHGNLGHRGDAMPELLQRMI